jgi:hypothetical protein
MSKISDSLNSQRISALKGHRLQDVPMEKRDIKQDRKQVVIKRKATDAKA